LIKALSETVSIISLTKDDLLTSNNNRHTRNSKLVYDCKFFLSVFEDPDFSKLLACLRCYMKYFTY